MVQRHNTIQSERYVGASRIRRLGRDQKTSANTRWRQLLIPEIYNKTENVLLNLEQARQSINEPRRIINKCEGISKNVTEY